MTIFRPPDISCGTDCTKLAREGKNNGEYAGHASASSFTKLLFLPDPNDPGSCRFCKQQRDVARASQLQDEGTADASVSSVLSANSRTSSVVSMMSLAESHDDREIEGYDDREIGGYDDLEIEGYDDREIEGYDDREIEGYDDREIEGYEDIEVDEDLELVSSEVPAGVPDPDEASACDFEDSPGSDGSAGSATASQEVSSSQGSSTYKPSQSSLEESSEEFDLQVS